MIKDFLVISCIGKNDKIALKVNENFFIHNFNSNIQSNDMLVISIFNLIKKHKINLNSDFSTLVNYGPGRFSSMRISIAVAKGLKLAKKINFFGYKNSDLIQFNLANIELLIKKKLVQKNLIKPLYLS
jgi:tRNA A37 threonylcarbamoyladenosine modification protein TsaB